MLTPTIENKFNFLKSVIKARLNTAPATLYAKVITLPKSKATIKTLMPETINASFKPNLYNKKITIMFGKPIFIPGAAVDIGGNIASK